MHKLFIHRVGHNPNRRVVILSSIHGDELSGFFIINRLFPWIKKVSRSADIEFVIIPFFNSSGIRTVARRDPESNHDLNRCFNLPTPPPAIARLKQISIRAKLVIDLHCFPKCRHAFTALFFHNPGHPATSAVNLKLTRLLQPDFIWQLDLNLHDKTKQGSFGPWLTEHDIPNFAVETDSPEFLSPAKINRISRSLKRAILSVFRPQLPPGPHSVCHRQVIHSPVSGIFTPLTSPNKNIISGQVIGTITCLSNRVVSVFSPVPGRIIFIRNPVFVNCREKLAGISLQEKI